MSTKRAKWIIVGFCFALLALSFLSLRYLPKRTIQAELAAIRAQGLPSSPEELNDWYEPVPEDQNQAVLILRAAKARTDASSGTDPGQVGSLDPGQPLPPETMEVINEHLADNQPALALLDKALRLPACRYPTDLSQGAYTLLPHLAQVKALTQLLRLQIVQSSGVRKTNEAVHWLTNSFTLAASLKDEPLLISDLVRIACVAITLNSLEWVLSEHQLSAQQLALLREKVAEAENAGRPALRRALIGERAGSISVFNMAFAELERVSGATSGQDEFPRDAIRALGSQAYRASGLRDRDMALYLETMNKFIKCSEKEFPAALEETEQTEAEVSARLSHGLGRFAKIYTSNLVPALGKTAGKEANITGRLRSATAALAIEQYRLDHGGALPDTLEQLVPQYLTSVPTDPFDGAPLVYERLPQKGYRVMGRAALARRNPTSSKTGKGAPAWKDVSISVFR